MPKDQIDKMDEANKQSTALFPGSFSQIHCTDVKEFTHCEIETDSIGKLFWFAFWLGAKIKK